MIVSFEHRFAFIKVQKTAGTSIEVVLSQVAGDSAIVTPINPPEAGHQPRNYEAVAGERPRARRSLRRGRSGGPAPAAAFYNHMPASEVRDRVGAATWEGLYRFCFERNPWDKAISMYYWRTRRLESPPPFEEWATTPGNLVSEHSMYTIDGVLAVDFVGRYESLDRDLRAVLDRLGLPGDLALPRAKSQFRPVGERTPIGPAADAAIRAEFAHEIEHLGYTRPADIPAN